MTPCLLLSYHKLRCFSVEDKRVIMENVNIRDFTLVNPRFEKIQVCRKIKHYTKIRFSTDSLCRELNEKK